MHKGFIRNRIENRIAGIRNRSRQDSGRSNSTPADASPPPVSGSMPSFSQLERMHSADSGFLLVDQVEGEGEGGKSQQEEGGEEREDDGMVHLSLEQRVDDPLSDMEGELEGLVIPDEEEEGEEGVGGGDEEPVRSKRTERAAKEEVGKPWLEGNRDIYEQQLELLQEHLTEAMLSNQTLQGENAELKGSQEELTRLRRENAILTRRLQTATEPSSNISDDSMEMDRATPKLELASKPSQKGAKGGGGEESRYGGSVLTVSSSSDGFETVSMSPDEEAIRQREQQRAEKQGFRRSMMERIYEFIALFTEEQSSPEDVVPEKPLSAKRLKNNLQRLSRTSKPWEEFGHALQDILQWKSLAQSLVVFSIYMYCVWHGWIISMMAFLAVLMLSLTYLRTSGLAEQFGFLPPTRRVENVDDLGFGDKLQLIKRVGQTCQNKAELISDSLEKAQNLFLWHQPVATKKVYINLCVFFIISILLPNSYVLTMIGLFVGIKLFIIDNIYRKYPKVKERYDGVAQMWRSLPTDAELLKRQSLTEEQLSTSTPGASVTSEDGRPTMRQSEEDMAFIDRFHLSFDELPLPSWRSGKRCSMMDREKPLSLTRSGKLYLTHGHLCFERNNRSQRDPDRFILPLKDVVRVVKAKPFAVLPGSGMSIEVTMKAGTKFLFSAILNRDQAYQSVLDQGTILGLPWGTDIEGVVTWRGRRGRGERSKKGSPSSSDNGSRAHSAEEGGEVTVKEE